MEKGQRHFGKAKQQTEIGQLRRRSPKQTNILFRVLGIRIRGPTHPRARNGNWITLIHTA